MASFNKPKIAIVGSGVAGLSAAWHFMKEHVPCEITLFEKSDRLGGHTNTVEITLDGVTAPVDTGFLVCNERTYPLFIPFLKEIDVPVVPTDMSFALSVGPHQFEWCGSSFSSLFSQPTNALSPRFWLMLKDVLRFNKQATAMAANLESDQQAHVEALNTPLQEFLSTNRFSNAFRDDYLVPMAAAIWSCSTKTMLSFPIGSFVRFFNNHGLLQITNRPQWFTVSGGAKQYVDKLATQLFQRGHAIALNSEVIRVDRQDRSVTIITKHGQHSFDAVVMACHSDQSLQTISQLTQAESSMLQGIPYQPNTAYLHTDKHLMPKRQKAWAAWNYLSERRGSDQEQSVAVTYWLNRLQPLPFKTDVFVSLNPIIAPAPHTVIQTISYEHPMFELGSTQSQKMLHDVQGTLRTWYAGAWTGYGFHEDGFRSGKLAALGAIQCLQNTNLLLAA